MIFGKSKRQYGVDVGTHYTKVCIVESGNLIGSARVKNNPNLKEVVKSATKIAHRAAGINPLITSFKSVTGYGAKYIASVKSQKSQAECIANATKSLNLGSVTVVDAGALFINLFTIDDDGRILDRLENDKCAAGNGSYIEMLSTSFGVPLSDFSMIVQQANDSYEIGSNCSVFAESEIVSQLNSGRDISEVASGIFYHIARKVAVLMLQIDTADTVVLIGGLARFDAFVKILEKVTSKKIQVLDQVEPDFVQAFGAALHS